MAFGTSATWRNQPHCPSRHLQRWPVPSGSQARSQTLFFSSSVCVPADCSARACCPSVTTSAGTSSGRSWIWPSAAGERGGAGGGAWLGGGAGSGVEWAGPYSGRKDRDESMSAVRERARRAGQRAARLREVPTLLVSIKGWVTTKPGGAGSLSPWRSPGSELITPPLGFLFALLRFSF